MKVRSINLEQYFTNDKTAEHCIKKAKEVIPDFDDHYIIEPSAGSGAFSKKIKGCHAFDIEPMDASIKKLDFLKATLFDITGDVLIDNSKKLLFIGNPPFGMGVCSLSYRFLLKCYKLGAEYIAFILPKGFYNNNKLFKYMELIYSEELNVEYEVINEERSRMIPTSFCMFKKTDKKIKGASFEIPFPYFNIKRGVKKGGREPDSKTERYYNKLEGEFLRFSNVGGNIGEIVNDMGNKISCEELIFAINDNTTYEMKEEAINFIKTYNWKEYIKERRNKNFPILNMTEMKELLIPLMEAINE